MKFIFKLFILSLIIFAVPNLDAKKPTRAKTTTNTTPSRRHQNVNFQAINDSMLVLADNYAEAVVNKPEMGNTRLNMLKMYYEKLPSEAAKDSVRTKLFDFYVDYVEKENEQRAEAFKRCFTEIAPANDEHWGPIYATDLIVATQKVDTLMLKETIVNLEDYAQRMNFDYDEELIHAKRFLHYVRTRPPIRQVLAGDWVSEDLAYVVTENGEIQHLHESKGASNYANGLQYLKIFHKTFPRNKEEIKTLEKGFKNNESNLFAVRDSLDMDVVIKGDEYLNIDTHKFNQLMTDELGSDRITPKESGKLVKNLKNLNFYDNYRYVFPTRVIIDDLQYGAYIYWGHEKLQRNNPMVGTLLRQTGQTIESTLATVAAQASSSILGSLGGSIGGSLVNFGFNLLADKLMVSKNQIWSIEMTIRPENPYELTADIFIQYVVAKSNNEQPEVQTYTHRCKYYKWEPDDDVFFFKKRNSKIIRFQAAKILERKEMTKAEEKEKNKYANEFLKEWKESYDQEKKNIKEKEKANNDNDYALKELDAEKEKNQKRNIASEFNDIQLEKLRRKSLNYNRNNPKR